MRPTPPAGPALGALAWPQSRGHLRVAGLEPRAADCPHGLARLARSDRYVTSDANCSVNAGSYPARQAVVLEKSIEVEARAESGGVIAVAAEGRKREAMLRQQPAG